MNKSLKIEPKQSLFDLSVQEYGSVEGLFSLMEDNNITSVNDNLPGGTSITIKQDAIEQRVVDYYEKYDKRVNGSYEVNTVVSTRAFSDGFNIGFS